METGHNISIISSSFFQWLQNGSQFYYWPILAWYQVLTYSVHVYARVCVCVCGFWPLYMVVFCLLALPLVVKEMAALVNDSS